MHRVIWHWTAGAAGVNPVEARAYHFIIQPKGDVVLGYFKPEDNIPPLKPNLYAAHTRALNSHSIGIALDAMAGAREHPFDAGPNPITPEQVRSLVRLTAKLCRQYSIPVSRKTTLSHAEVQRSLGVPQRQKWDITWLPGMPGPRDPIVVGDMLRVAVEQEMAVQASPWARIKRALKGERE